MRTANNSPAADATLGSLLQMSAAITSLGQPATVESGNETPADLLRKIEQLEHFVDVAAHDLQEPLRMVAGFTQLLAEEYGQALDPRAVEFLNYAREGSRRMQDLVDGLVLLARSDPHRDLRRTISSAEPVQVALDNLRLAISESHATIRLQNLPEVWADPPQLARLFQNLIANSIRHRFERPLEISVEGRERAQDWLFRIADNGPGFPASPAAGLGLGLDICRRIVERHGGQLWMDAPSNGAVVCFTLAKP